MTRSPQAPDRPQLDPVLIHARREVVAVLIAFGVCALWSISWCYSNGFHKEVTELDKIMGMPAWVFWGIAVPWVACDVFIAWLCFFYMEDDPLGEELDERDTADGPVGAGSGEAGHV